MTDGLADIVRSRRLGLGLTQDEAAEHAGVSVSTWRNLEGGRMSGFRTRTLVVIAKTLQIPVAEFFALTAFSMVGERDNAIQLASAHQALNGSSSGRDATLWQTAKMLGDLPDDDLAAIAHLVQRLHGSMAVEPDRDEPSK